MKQMFAKILFLAVFTVPFFSLASPTKKGGEFYQVIVYHFATANNKIQLSNTSKTPISRATPAKDKDHWRIPGH
jgi:hypothetical protein